MTSDSRVVLDADTAYVWIWLPGDIRPVVAGAIQRGDDGSHAFRYGASYLDRPDALPLYYRQLPLDDRQVEAPDEQHIPGVLRDAVPDSWGQRVVDYLVLGETDSSRSLGMLDYMLNSGSDRTGALDFQASPYEYVPRQDDDSTLDELRMVSELIDEGKEIPASLARALIHGTSIGGARPKALVKDLRSCHIAKFPSSTDPHPVVEGEFVAMRLAKHVGLDVADVRMERVDERNVLLVERFDRQRRSGAWMRRMMISALTLADEPEHGFRYVSYQRLMDAMRRECVDEAKDRWELFRRLCFNVAIGNSDDHPRNHAFFIEGEALALTPAYDLCPQRRSTGEVGQAMPLYGDVRAARLGNCLRAGERFGFKEARIRCMLREMADAMVARWADECDRADLPAGERELFVGRQFFNPSILYDLAENDELRDAFDARRLGS